MRLREIGRMMDTTGKRGVFPAREISDENEDLSRRKVIESSEREPDEN
jgi:hypothetical protein